MDPAYPVTNDLTYELVFPIPDVLDNSWALIPKCSEIKKQIYLPGSFAIWENAVFIGDIGSMLLYRVHEDFFRGKGFSRIYALAQLGVESTPGRELPIQFWIPIFSSLNHKWQISEESCERYYNSRGWIPFKDVVGDSGHAIDPLPRKWVRIGVSEGEGQLVTHEADTLPFALPAPRCRAIAS
jgi:hypothetical protein